jgi:hypothetical protein
MEWCAREGSRQRKPTTPEPPWPWSSYGQRELPERSNQTTNSGNLFRASRTESHGTGVSCRLLLCWKYRCRVPVFVQLCDVFVSSRGCAQFVALNCFLSHTFLSPMNTLCAVHRCTSCCIARSTHVQHRAIPHRSCVRACLHR